MQVEIEQRSSLVKLAAVVIIIAGLIAAKTIVIPILLAIFITILTSPLLIWLKGKGLNSAFSLMSVMAVIVIVITLLGALVSASLQDFASNLPMYEAKLRESLSALTRLLNERGVDFSQETILGLVNPAKLAQFTSELVKGFGSALANGFMVLLLVIFMLLEVSVFPKKLHAIHADASEHAAEFLGKVKQYMVIKSIFSLLTGVAIYIALLIIGVDYALLWAVLAFVLNFVPNIGSIIAAIPAVLLTLLQLGFIGALEVAMTFVIVNIVLGSVLEPKYMGKGLGLSTLVVFVSLIFWGWVFGPVGMLLSIPLTIMLKLALQVNPQTQWIAILLDSDVNSDY